ncbi:MAG: hypothetical protein KKD48_04675 [Nanoarchaeota archaeon]|nr:hypothetical protein [Nanoarchaeota archaeon]
MEIEKILLFVFIAITLGVIIFSVFGFKIPSNNNPSNSNYANIPEKCRPSAGYDIESWKEHLSHHTETQECLQYFK